VAPSIQTLERLSRALNVSEASLLGDQRAVLEQFFAVLNERGVQISSPEQGERLANAVADMITSLKGVNGPIDPSNASPSVVASIDQVRAWLDEPVDSLT
jgi:hypothetical protein